MSNEKKPGYFLYIGDYTTQLYKDYFINHEIRIPINQPGKAPVVFWPWLTSPALFLCSVLSQLHLALEVQSIVGKPIYVDKAVPDPTQAPWTGRCLGFFVGYLLVIMWIVWRGRPPENPNSKNNDSLMGFLFLWVKVFGKKDTPQIMV